MSSRNILDPDRDHRTSGVVILGMSRSGTSAVTEMFHRAGFFVGAPEDLMAADYSNPRGYFENLRVYAENERILSDFGGSWMSPPPPGAMQPWAEQTSARLRELLEGMVQEASGRPIAIKDPRIGVLLPVWKPAFQGLLHSVIVVRHPVEIGMSLSHRDLTPIPVVLAAWEVHMTALLAELQGEPVTVVQYAELLERSELAGALVTEVGQELVPYLRQALNPARAAESRDPALRRNQAAPEEPGTRFTPFQEDLWRFFSELPSGTVTLDAPLRLLSATAASMQAISIERERLSMVARLRAELHKAQSKSAGLTAELQARAAEAERLKAAIQAVQSSHSWRMTSPLRKLGSQVKHRQAG